MKQPWTFSVTGYGLQKKPVAEIVDLCVATGIGGIEGCPPLFDGMSESAAAQVGQSFRAAGLSVDSFHLPFDARLDMASFYRTQRKKATEELKPWIARAAATGAKAAILHPTTSSCDADLEGIDACLSALGASLELLLPFASEHRVILALENMLPGEATHFSARPEHFERIHRELAHPSLGFCLDTGHALIAGGPDGAHRFFEAMEPALVAFHLSDSSGDRDIHIAPGRGLVDWDRFFKAAARIGFDRTMCIETAPFAHAVNGGFPLEAWRGLVADTQKLARAAVG